MMSNLSMVEAKLPPGFRFHPRDEELVCDYLMKKLTSSDCLHLLIEVDLNKCEPWEIPETARVGGKEWYFYSQRDRKYATGLRTNRATVSGYWKATGKDRPVSRKNALVGMRKTLVFYQGRAPKGRKTNWVMHEFRAEGQLTPPQLSSLKEDWVLCRVFHKNSDEVPAKQGMGSRHNHDDTISSSSLPSLMDSYISFDQSTQPNNTITTDDDDQYEQVPCFSIFSPNQINPITFSSHTINNYDNNHNNNNNNNGDGDGGIPELGSTCLSPFSNCDRNVLQAVLNHLTNMDNNPNMKGSFGTREGTTSESFLSDVGFPTMWDQY